MKLNLVLTLAAIWMALLGLLTLILPAQFYFLEANASPTLVSLLRVQASTFLSIALLDWMARNSDSSKARDAIVLANTVGSGLAAVLLVLAMLSGAPTFIGVSALISALFAVAFYWIGRASMSTVPR